MAFGVDGDAELGRFPLHRDDAKDDHDPDHDLIQIYPHPRAVLLAAQRLEQAGYVLRRIDKADTLAIRSGLSPAFSV